jgi:hypothetical protein
MSDREQMAQALKREDVPLAEIKTQPLPTLRALAFQAFLARHSLSLLEVALAAGVRLLTVWRVTRDLPVTSQQAERVRAGLYRLTGVRYRGGLTVYVVETLEHPLHAEKQEGEER